MSALVPFEDAEVHGLRDPAVGDAELARAAAWLAAGEVEGEPIKPGRAWRADDRLVKLFGAPRGPARLRRAPALREARAALAIDPVPTPAPRIALVCRTGPRRGASLLATDFVHGLPLGDAWQSDERAVAALADFVLAQHAHGVFHGDPHPGNQLWDGERWWLIDLEGLRSRSRRLRTRRLALLHWARIWLNLEIGGRGPEPRIRECVAHYAERAWPGADPDRVLARVEAEIRALRARRSRSVSGERDSGHSGSPGR